MVERLKPRLCIDGGPHLGIGDTVKLPCELDTISMVMNNLNKNRQSSNNSDIINAAESLNNIKDNPKSNVVGFKVQGI